MQSWCATQYVCKFQTKVFFRISADSFWTIPFLFVEVMFCVCMCCRFCCCCLWYSYAADCQMVEVSASYWFAHVVLGCVLCVINPPWLLCVCMYNFASFQLAICSAFATFFPVSFVYFDVFAHLTIFCFSSCVFFFVLLSLIYLMYLSLEFSVLHVSVFFVFPCMRFFFI